MKEMERPSLGATNCPGCTERDRKIAKLEGELAKAMKMIKALQARIGLNSRNSSMPPSKDPPSAPPRPKKPTTGRKPGGQPGHPGTQRELIPPEEVDEVIPYYPETCEECKAPLAEEPGPEDPPPIRHQVTELPERLVKVTEHQVHARTCERCKHLTWAQFPPGVACSDFGPRLAATASYLSGACQVSRRGVEQVMEDVFGTPIALGTVANLEQEVSEALAPAHEEAAEEVSNAPAKNLDETGWKEKGKKCWLWTAATCAVAFFIIHGRRSREALRALLKDKLKGVFTSDRMGAYRARATRMRQICWAHLDRDFQRLIELGGKGAEIGKIGREVAYWVFMNWKDFKAGVISRQELQDWLYAPRKDLRKALEKGARLRDSKPAIFSENLLELEPALWTFTRCEGVEPTNNRAERVLRTGVLWRNRSFGSQSDKGCRFAERILTVVQTLRLQKRSILNYIVEALKAHREGRRAPSLLHP